MGCVDEGWDSSARNFSSRGEQGRGADLDSEPATRWRKMPAGSSCRGARRLVHPPGHPRRPWPSSVAAASQLRRCCVGEPTLLMTSRAGYGHGSLIVDGPRGAGIGSRSREGGETSGSQGGPRGRGAAQLHRRGACRLYCTNAARERIPARPSPRMSFFGGAPTGAAPAPNPFAAAASAPTAFGGAVAQPQVGTRAGPVRSGQCRELWRGVRGWVRSQDVAGRPAGSCRPPRGIFTVPSDSKTPRAQCTTHPDRIGSFKETRHASLLLYYSAAYLGRVE